MSNEKIKLLKKNFKEISSSLLRELYKLAKVPSGNEVLNTLKHQKNSIKTDKTSLIIKQKLFTLYENFFKEFTVLINHNEENDLVQMECDTEMFNNLLLVIIIILNDNMKNETEKTLQTYLEIYFKQLDDKIGISNLNKSYSKFNIDCDEDTSSQYSTLSSFLGLQVKK